MAEVQSNWGRIGQKATHSGDGAIPRKPLHGPVDRTLNEKGSSIGFRVLRKEDWRLPVHLIRDSFALPNSEVNSIVTTLFMCYFASGAVP